MSRPNGNIARVDRLLMPGIALLALGLILFGITAIANPEQFIYSYLYAYMFWSVLVFGFLGLILLYHLLKARWGETALRLFEAGGGPVAIIATAVGFIPIALSANSLYPWMNQEMVAGDSVMQHKSAYLNFPFWLARAVLYFALFAFIAWWQTTKQRRYEETGQEKYRLATVNHAGWMFVAYVLVITFAYTDWVMSLEPHWFSTVYGAWLGTGGILAALAFSAAVIFSQSDKSPYKEILVPRLRKDFAWLLIALTMFWAYLSFSQYLIIWSGNLPEFVTYYILRDSRFWDVVGAVAIIGQFFAPFVFLVADPHKQAVKWLAFVAGWIFVIRFADIAYIVIPAFPDQYQMNWLMHLAGLAALGGAWLIVFATQVRNAPLLPSFNKTPEEAHGHV
jgi:hypothetical protein